MDYFGGLDCCLKTAAGCLTFNKTKRVKDIQYLCLY